MPFFVRDPEWQARLSDGIPGQSLIHRPTMEGSDGSSSDDEDTEIEENLDPNRRSETSHPNPHTAVEEYRRSQVEEVIVAIKDFDTFGARSHYTHRGGVSGHSHNHRELDQDRWTGHESSTTAVSTEGQAAGNEQGERVDFGNHADRQLRTSHVLCGRDLTPPYSTGETSTSVTPPEQYSYTESSVSDFVQWPAPSQTFAAPSPHRRTVDADKDKEPKLKSKLVSAARSLFSRLSRSRSPQPDNETSTANHSPGDSVSARSRATSSSSVYADPNYVDISLH